MRGREGGSCLQAEGPRVPCLLGQRATMQHGGALQQATWVTPAASSGAPLAPAARATCHPAMADHISSVPHRQGWR